MTDTTATHPRPPARSRSASPAPVRWHVDGPVASRRRRRRLRHIPALDGLRAAAVLAVMLYHGGVSWMEGGYLGVDAFFVLSGFLITALLLGEWRSSGTIAFGQFWIRRARRLLPALGLVALGVIAYGAFLAPADQLSTLRSDLFASLGYVTNWRMIFSGQGYFDQFAAPSPLRHVWSLAIEEQFYLVWPLVVYGLMRWVRMPWRWMATLFGGLAIASALWMAAAFGSEGINRAYYGTDTRAQALLIGAALAVVYVSVGPVRAGVARRALSAATALAVGVTAWLWVTAGDTSTWLYEGGYFLAAIAIATVITRVAQPDPGLLGAVLALPVLQWIGRISYGLYLWHWPIFVTVTADRVGIDGTALLLVRFALTFVAATASYYLVELPVRNGALRGWRSWVAVPTAVGAIVALALLVTADGRSVVGGDVARAAAAEVREGNDEAEEGFASRADEVAEARATGLLVVGDSVSLTLGLGLQEVGLDHKVFTVTRSQMGCGITHQGEVLVEGRVQSINDYCNQVPKWTADVQELRPDIVLLLIGAWDAYDRRIDGRLIEFGTPEWDALITADLQAAVDALSSTGAKVALSTVPHYENRSVVNRPAEFRSAFDPWRVDHLNELIRGTVAANRDRTALVDLQAYIANGNQGLLEDGVHFGADSRKVVGAWLAPRLRELSRSAIASGGSS